MSQTRSEEGVFTNTEPSKFVSIVNTTFQENSSLEVRALCSALRPKVMLLASLLVHLDEVIDLLAIFNRGASAPSDVAVAAAFTSALADELGGELAPYYGKLVTTLLPLFRVRGAALRPLEMATTSLSLATAAVLGVRAVIQPFSADGVAEAPETRVTAALVAGAAAGAALGASNYDDEAVSELVETVLGSPETPKTVTFDQIHFSSVLLARSVACPRGSSSALTPAAPALATAVVTWAAAAVPARAGDFSQDVSGISFDLPTTVLVSFVRQAVFENPKARAILGQVTAAILTNAGVTAVEMTDSGRLEVVRPTPDAPAGQPRSTEPMHVPVPTLAHVVALAEGLRRAPYNAVPAPGWRYLYAICELCLPHAGASVVGRAIADLVTTVASLAPAAAAAATKSANIALEAKNTAKEEAKAAKSAGSKVEFRAAVAAAKAAGQEAEDAQAVAAAAEACFNQLRELLLAAPVNVAAGVADALHATPRLHPRATALVADLAARTVSAGVAGGDTALIIACHTVTLATDVTAPAAELVTAATVACNRVLAGGEPEPAAAALAALARLAPAPGHAGGLLDLAERLAAADTTVACVLAAGAVDAAASLATGADRGVVDRLLALGVGAVRHIVGSTSSTGLGARTTHAPVATAALYGALSAATRLGTPLLANLSDLCGLLVDLAPLAQPHVTQAVLTVAAACPQPNYNPAPEDAGTAERTARDGPVRGLTDLAAMLAGPLDHSSAPAAAAVVTRVVGEVGADWVPEPVAAAVVAVVATLPAFTFAPLGTAALEALTGLAATRPTTLWATALGVWQVALARTIDTYQTGDALAYPSIWQLTLTDTAAAVAHAAADGTPAGAAALAAVDGEVPAHRAPARHTRTANAAERLRKARRRAGGTASARDIAYGRDAGEAEVAATLATLAMAADDPEVATYALAERLAASFVSDEGARRWGVEAVNSLARPRYPSTPADARAADVLPRAAHPLPILQDATQLLNAAFNELTESSTTYATTYATIAREAVLRATAGPAPDSLADLRRGASAGLWVPPLGPGAVLTQTTALCLDFGTAAVHATAAAAQPSLGLFAAARTALRLPAAPVRQAAARLVTAHVACAPWLDVLERPLVALTSDKNFRTQITLTHFGALPADIDAAVDAAADAAAAPLSLGGRHAEALTALVIDAVAGAVRTHRERIEFAMRWASLGGRAVLERLVLLLTDGIAPVAVAAADAAWVSSATPIECTDEIVIESIVSITPAPATCLDDALAAAAAAAPALLALPAPVLEGVMGALSAAISVAPSSVAGGLAPLIALIAGVAALSTTDDHPHPLALPALPAPWPAPRVLSLRASALDLSAALVAAVHVVDTGAAALLAAAAAFRVTGMRGESLGSMLDSKSRLPRALSFILQILDAPELALEAANAGVGNALVVAVSVLALESKPEFATLKPVYETLGRAAARAARALALANTANNTAAATADEVAPVLALEGVVFTELVVATPTSVAAKDTDADAPALALWYGAALDVLEGAVVRAGVISARMRMRRPCGAEAKALTPVLTLAAAVAPADAAALSTAVTALAPLLAARPGVIASSDRAAVAAAVAAAIPSADAPAVDAVLAAASRAVAHADDDPTLFSALTDVLTAAPHDDAVALAAALVSPSRSPEALHAADTDAVVAALRAAAAVVAANARPAATSLIFALALRFVAMDAWGVAAARAAAAAVAQTVVTAQATSADIRAVIVAGITDGHAGALGTFTALAAALAASPVAHPLAAALAPGAVFWEGPVPERAAAWQAAAALWDQVTPCVASQHDAVYIMRPVLLRVLQPALLPGNDSTYQGALAAVAAALARHMALPSARATVRKLAAVATGNNKAAVRCIIAFVRGISLPEVAQETGEGEVFDQVVQETNDENENVNDEAEKDDESEYEYEYSTDEEADADAEAAEAAATAALTAPLPTPSYDDVLTVLGGEIFTSLVALVAPSARRVRRRRALTTSQALADTAGTATIAVAAVECLRHLRRKDSDPLVPQLVLPLVRGLQVRDGDVRAAYRTTLQAVATTLGPRFLGFIVRQLGISLHSGFHAGVGTYTAAQVAVEFARVADAKEQAATGHTTAAGALDCAIGPLLAVAQDIAFGRGARARSLRQETGTAAALVQEEAVDLSPVLLRTLAGHCSFPYLVRIVGVVRTELATRPALAVVDQCRKLLDEIAVGVRLNPTVCGADLINFVVDVIQAVIVAEKQTAARVEAAAAAPAAAVSAAERRWQAIEVRSVRGALDVVRLQNERAVVAATPHPELLLFFALSLLRSELAAGIDLTDSPTVQAMKPLPVAIVALISHRDAAVAAAALRVTTLLTRLAAATTGPAAAAARELGLDAAVQPLFETSAALLATLGSLGTDLGAAAGQCVAALLRTFGLRSRRTPVRDLLAQTPGQTPAPAPTALVLAPAAATALAGLCEREIAAAYTSARLLVAVQLLHAVLRTRVQAPGIVEAGAALANIAVNSTDDGVAAAAQAAAVAFVGSYPLAPRLRQKHIMQLLTTATEFPTSTGRLTALAILTDLLPRVPRDEFAPYAGGAAALAAAAYAAAPSAAVAQAAAALAGVLVVAGSDVFGICTNMLGEPETALAAAGLLAALYSPEHPMHAALAPALAAALPAAAAAAATAAAAAFAVRDSVERALDISADSHSTVGAPELCLRLLGLARRLGAYATSVDKPALVADLVSAVLSPASLYHSSPLVRLATAAAFPALPLPASADLGALAAGLANVITRATRLDANDAVGLVRAAVHVVQVAQAAPLDAPPPEVIARWEGSVYATCVAEAGLSPELTALWGPTSSLDGQGLRRAVVRLIRGIQRPADESGVRVVVSVAAALARTLAGDATTLTAALPLLALLIHEATQREMQPETAAFVRQARDMLFKLAGDVSEEVLAALDRYIAIVLARQGAARRRAAARAN